MIVEKNGTSRYELKLFKLSNNASDFSQKFSNISA